MHLDILHTRLFVLVRVGLQRNGRRVKLIERILVVGMLQRLERLVVLLASARAVEAAIAVDDLLILVLVVVALSLSGLTVL